MRYGVIGLGLMGRRMAARLAESGQEPVSVYSRTRTSLGAGLTWRGSPREVGEHADQILLMLPDGRATHAVLDGPDSLLSALGHGKTVINAATVGREAALEIGQRVTGTGAAYLDAPVLGSTGAAEQGHLLFLVGGAEETLDRCRPALERLGRRIIYMGAVGRGSAAKLLFNAQLGIAMAGLADTLRLAGVLDIPRSFVIDEVLPSPVTAPALAAKKPLLAGEPFEPQFALEWMVKDLKLAAASAKRGDASVPLISAALGRFAEAVEFGLDSEDFAAVGSPLES